VHPTEKKESDEDMTVYHELYEKCNSIKNSSNYSEPVRMAVYVPAKRNQGRWSVREFAHGSATERLRELKIAVRAQGSEQLQIPSVILIGCAVNAVEKS